MRDARWHGTTCIFPPISILNATNLVKKVALPLSPAGGYSFPSRKGLGKGDLWERD